MQRSLLGATTQPGTGKMKCGCAEGSWLLQIKGRDRDKIRGGTCRLRFPAKNQMRSALRRPAQPRCPPQAPLSPWPPAPSQTRTHSRPRRSCGAWYCRRTTGFPGTYSLISSKEILAALTKHRGKNLTGGLGQAPPKQTAKISIPRTSVVGPPAGASLGRLRPHPLAAKRPVPRRKADIRAHRGTATPDPAAAPRPRSTTWAWQPSCFSRGVCWGGGEQAELSQGFGCCVWLPINPLPSSSGPSPTPSPPGDAACLTAHQGQREGSDSDPS